ncbi:hypothetical protein [Ectobacillus funiculus]|uniref:hypothetical protein n=1 Tax=Ectobacillus funiculus TaxID=137993 RepID=UPI00397E73BC
MDMFDSGTDIIDSGEKLSFVLQLMVGGGEKGDVIFLDRLCESPRFISQCIYDVQELKPIRLSIQNSTEKVTFTWNKVYEGKKGEKEWKYELGPEKATVLIYEHGKTDYLYPWRCGMYHFEVMVAEACYYGAFRITPKNFSNDGMQLIQEKVMSIVSSLIVDRGHYKKTFSSFAELEDHSYMQTIRWLSQHTVRVKQLCAQIEHEVQYGKGYRTEQRIRKQTKHTARKNALLAERGAMKSCNVRFFEDYNSASNRYMKRKLKEFEQLIYQLLRFLNDHLDKLERLEESSKREKQAIQTILQTIEKNGSVTDRDKQKYRNMNLLKDTDLRKALMKRQEYKVLHEIVRGMHRDLSAFLHSRFWGSISDEGNVRLPNTLTPPRRQLLKILETSYRKSSTHMNEPAFLFVHKPTFLIYEYYSYFAVISILEEIGFQPLAPVREQIQSYFYLDGLQDGTTVVLERGDAALHIVFNELIETHPIVALSKGSHFYNGEDTKKPDIRIDYYRTDHGIKRYQSSVIVEVKYSPMYNIFQPVGNTKATEQMYKYWSIKYVEEQNGKRIFQRRAIYEVVCVYPGSQVHAKKIEAGCGVFLQFYPHKTKQRGEFLVGKGECIRLFREWLQL